jgi:hypothetical protein
MGRHQTLRVLLGLLTLGAFACLVALLGLRAGHGAARLISLLLAGSVALVSYFLYSVLSLRCTVKTQLRVKESVSGTLNGHQTPDR